MKKRFAFTLAEVLITLGIIGVIAAISIPMLITKTQKVIAETKLKHFYSEINQAFKLSAHENEVDVDGWVTLNKPYTEAEMNEFLKTFVLPYMNVSYTKRVARNPNSTSDARILVVLNNGTAFSMYIDKNGADIFFHPDPEKNDFSNPRYSFAFQLAKRAVNSSDSAYNSMDFVQPYVFDWDGTMQMLRNDSRYGCSRTSRSKQYCAKYIEMNNWKIPWDYPW